MLTPAEQAFALRMVPHLERGLSFEDAARAVLEDDARLMAVTLASDAHLAIFPDSGPRACVSGSGRTGAEIRSNLAHTVYDRLRAA